ncbi:MAG: ferritin-like domain-containing protein [Candidatus Binatia bacterium]
MAIPKARPTREWIEYFLQNRSHLLPIPWELGAELRDEERAAIRSSIQAFQLGESSEGRNLMRYARAWAARSCDIHYVEAIGMLIAEEQRHARDLGRFMELNGIPCIRRRWTDSVFRRLRNFVGTLEVSIGVLVTAEMIAKVYYAALREASQSTLLHCICDQILRDEARHVEFQTEQLAKLQQGRSALLLWATCAVHQLLFVGATLVVAWSHRSTLSRGGFSFGRFWRACLGEFRSSVLSRRPKPSRPLKATIPTPAC